MEEKIKNISVKEYNYELPANRIAEFPLSKRDQSKFLIYNEGKIEDDVFNNLSKHLPGQSTLILNDTKVIEARILFQKLTGGVIEIFCLEPFQKTIEQSLTTTCKVFWKCLIGGASKWKAGQILEKKVSLNNISVVLTAKYISKQNEYFIIEFLWLPQFYCFADILHAAGGIPLPPYIKRNATADDKKRYQTIFSKYEGSVAAPTAALHFTENIFNDLAAKKINAEYITLHIGAGTFKPVKTETIAQHEMHEEPFIVSLNVLKKVLAAKKIICVGTTSLRTIETLHWLGVKLMNRLISTEWNLKQWEAYELEKNYPEISSGQSLKALIDWLEKNDQKNLHCKTSLIIVPGYDFKIAEGLITNFHQPQSTLLLLVSAFIGKDWKKIYQHALDNNYRFLSYGDSSLLWKKTKSSLTEIQ